MHLVTSFCFVQSTPSENLKFSPKIQFLEKYQNCGFVFSCQKWIDFHFQLSKKNHDFWRENSNFPGVWTFKKRRFLARKFISSIILYFKITVFGAKIQIIHENQVLKNSLKHFFLIWIYNFEVFWKLNFWT